MADLSHTVASAHIAQTAWAAQPIRARLAILKRFRHALATRARETFAPVLLGSVNPDMALVNEEITAPVLSLFTVPCDEEA